MLSKTLSVLLVVYFLSDSSHGQRNFRKDYTYIEAFGSYYKFHGTTKQWRDAKRVCSEEGASLFYPQNKDEADAVISFWKRYQYSPVPSNTWVYVGMSDIITEGLFETIDGTYIKTEFGFDTNALVYIIFIPRPKVGKSVSEVYSNFYSGQPDNYYEEDCVHMNQEGVWNDIKCDLEYGFICKKSFQSLDRNYMCTKQQSDLDGQRNFRKDYTYIEAFGSYYKFHGTTKQWSDAKRVCSEEGASLFYPQNKNEADAVISFWKRYQYSPVPSNTWVYVGMSDIITEGVFETIDGKSVSEVHSNFYSGQPDNSHNEDCVHMNQEGVWNDIKCDSEYGFICKKSFQSLDRNHKCTKQESDLDYTFSKTTGNYYKLYTTPLTWTEAYDMCRAEHSHLAVINNALEADYLAKLTKSVAKQRFGGIYHLGVHRVPNQGWQTITGQIMWGNFVLTADDDKECGSMSSSGLLSNIDCSTKSFFICEREVNNSTESTNEENYK